MKDTQAEPLLDSRPGYRPDIDGLRAVAVLAVIGYHYFPRWVPSGFVGVDIFFVISGFLISGIILDGLAANKFSFLEFYARRIRRLFPALLLVLTVVLIFGWAALLPGEYQGLGKHVAGGASFIANFLYWQESGYFDSEAITKPLLHLWSLGIEEQFYLIFPCLLYGFWKSRFRVIFCIALVFFISLYWNLHLEHRDHAADFYSPFSRFWELLAGAILAAAQRRWTFTPQGYGSICGLSVADILSILGGGGAMLAIFFFREKLTYPGHWALLPVIAAVLVIAAGQHSFFNRRLLSSRLLVAIGLISYPLYLWHWPILSYLQVVGGEFPERSVRIAAAVTAIILAYLTYRFVERPLRFGSRGRSAKVFVLASLMLLIGGMGLAIKIGDGLPERAHIQYFFKATESLRAHLVPPYSVHNDEQCFAYVPALSTYDKMYCQFTNVGSKETVALIGDSHAIHAGYGVANLAPHMGFNAIVLANAGISPLLGLRYPTYHDEKQAVSTQATKAVIDTVLSHQDIKKVFIVTLGWTYLTGKYASGYSHQHTIPPESYKNSLQDTVNTLSSAGKEVFIVTGLPQIKGYLQNYIARPYRKARSLPPLYKAEALELQKEYLQIMEQLENVTIINTLDLFCPTEECLAFSAEGLALYSDDNHLSLTGSDFLAKELLKKYLPSL